MKKLVVEVGGKEYEFTGGGSGVAPADSVGSEEIKDESVEMEDLSPGVKEQMAERVTQEDLAGFQV